MRNVDPSLITKLGSQEQTISNNADPKMFVAVARAKSTVVDSSYWTVETIRTGATLGDVSLAARRQMVTGPPNRIYEIHVINGEVKTSIREYPDKLKDGFIDQFSMGTGSAVALAFDGEWQRYRNLWRLVTSEKPWIAWVDSASKLWVQYWDDVSTKLEIATDVVSVRMIRGWKNATIEYLDQGIVVAYIKTDGRVYYRNYAVQENYDLTWEYEKELTEFTGTAVSLNLFITNDYRMGFVIEDSLNQVHWLVTDRNWGGMASPAENITSSFKDITFTVIPITYYDTADDENITVGFENIFFNVAEPIYPVPVEASNDDATTIRLTFSHMIDADLSAVASAFTIKDSLNVVFPIISTSAGVDNTEIIFAMPNFGSANGNMTIIYDRNIAELDSVNQGSRFAVESFSLIFTPDLAPPEGHLNENLTVSITPTFVVSRVDYNNTFETENLTVGPVITFVVTKVGTNPL